MGLNDQMASMILGELDEMTKTIEKTAAHLDSQLARFTAMESRIENHVRTLTFLKQGLNESPSQREVIQYWKDELREIHMTGRKARQDTFDALGIAVDKSINNAYGRLQVKGDEIFIQAANQFSQTITTCANDTAANFNGTLESICTNLRNRADKLIQYSAIGIVTSALVASIFSSIVTTYMLK